MDYNEFLSRICGFIPGKVDDRIVLEVYELMQKVDHLFHRDPSPSSIRNNTAALLSHLPALQKTGYVEDQNNYADMSYGVTTMKHAGCEIFAVYNALHTLRHHPAIPLPELIHSFEKEGMVLSGRFGTSPKSVVRFLNRIGYKTEVATDPLAFNELGRRYKALILTMYNNAADIRDEIHTVHISRSSSGFIAHNVCCNGIVTGPEPDILSLIRRFNKGKARGICLIGINK